MTWIDCGLDQLEAIRAIFNDAIANTTALYEDEPRTLEVMQAWLAAKQQAGLPVLGLVDDSGKLAGFATYGPFRPHPGYRFTVEHSVYVDKHFQGQGLGRRLLEKLIATAEHAQIQTMIGVIDADNDVSIRLHKSLGFHTCAHIRRCGFKFGRWLDVVMMQRYLDEAAADEA